MAREVVLAQPAQPPRSGLLVSAPINSDNAVRWQAGITWEAEACNGGDSGPANCAPLDRDVTPDTPGSSVSNPFLVWALEACSTLGFHGRDWQGRARRALAATQSQQVAHEFWTGAITKVEFPSDADQRSPYLADASTVDLGGSASAPQAALSAVESAVMTCSGGRRAMLSMPTWLIEPIMTNTSYIRLDGNQLVTALGNIVVADPGFPGTKPEAHSAGSSNSWIYGSLVPLVYLDEVETFPASLNDARDLAAMVNFPTNNAVAWAQRLALVQLDPCCRFAAETNVPIPD